MKRTLIALAILIVAVLGALFIWHGNAAAPTQSDRRSNKNTSQLTSTVPGSSFDKQAYSTSDPASPWVVVNKQHPLNPLTYAPTDLTAVGNGQFMRAEAATALASMLAGATVAGYSVTPASGYRSYQTQVATYSSEVKSYGQAVADSESARAGYSEHQTGWAMDLASGGCSITDCFGDTPGGKWVADNAYKYGFLLRYSPSNTSATGYRAESWHFRYVGTKLAQELHDESISTLEQFFGISGGATYK